jgi:adenosylcobinamide kinase/adenosylcobinamide-phosphate guanylyltransferase
VTTADRARPNRTLVLGGVRSGKSVWAEAAASTAAVGRATVTGTPEVTYVATAPDRPDDPEWAERVAAHRARRPAGWRTVQTGDLAGALTAAGPGDVLLVDDIGSWLTRVIDDVGGWQDRSRLDLVRAATDDLLAAWRATSGRVVAVSNEVGYGVVPASYAGRLFRDEQGRLNTMLAAESDEVVLVVAGIPMWLRGKEDQ